MNKARRHELKMLKYKRRLKTYSFDDEGKGNYYAFRSHSCPCSCYACQQVEDTYNRAVVKRNSRKEIFEDYEDLIHVEG